MISSKKPLFEIPDLMKGTFLSRPNRFIGEIKYKGRIETAHIHNPGRLKELLIETAEILLTYSQGKFFFIYINSTVLLTMIHFFLFFSRIIFFKSSKISSHQIQY
ncbi:MAG: hypothetical protein HWN81_04835 [Candidatus Lokiarchaeota archaeon]|nr:hypothetical protein [Candidatus Lokiarchaeota archaeon]